MASRAWASRRCPHADELEQRRLRARPRRLDRAAVAAEDVYLPRGIDAERQRVYRGAAPEVGDAIDHRVPGVLRGVSLAGRPGDRRHQRGLRLDQRLARLPQPCFRHSDGEVGRGCAGNEIGEQRIVEPLPPGREVDLRGRLDVDGIAGRHRERCCRGRRVIRPDRATAQERGNAQHGQGAIISLAAHGASVLPL